jgi:hypothetical protein
LVSCADDSSVDREPEDQATGEFIDDSTYRVFPANADNFDIAEFRLWVPETENRVKAVLVLLGSHNFNGLGLGSTEEWRSFALREEVAILSVHFKVLDSWTGYYPDAHLGTGQALLTALQKLSEASGNNYINDLPFLLRGYSAGGVFSYSFSAFQPDRVVAFANIRGGGLNVTPDNNLKVPGLMFYGDEDLPERNERIKGIVASRRSVGGLWCLVREPHTGHYGELKEPDNLIRMLFSKALNKRLQGNHQNLTEIKEAEGWLGDQVSYETAPYNEFPGDKTMASWLLDEEFASNWKGLQEN